MIKKESFRVAVLNYSGNVGKSTLAKHLLQPRLEGCPILYVESINEGGDDTNIKGKDFAAVMIEVLTNDRVVVDIGSSNIEQVFAKVARMGDVLNEFDHLVVPTVPKAKQQADTIKLLRDVIRLGVEPGKIKVVLNHVEPGDDVDVVFAPVLQAIAAVGGIEYAVVHESEGFSMLSNPTIRRHVSGARDLRQEIAQATSKAMKHELATALVAQRIVRSLQAELDAVFAQLFSSQEQAA